MVSKVLFSSKSDEWSLPCAPDTYAHVVTCTDDSREFASMICTFIDVWAADHEVDKVKYAAKIADMVKRKKELDESSLI